VNPDVVKKNRIEDQSNYRINIVKIYLSSCEMTAVFTLLLTLK
jgi:hypothetical protein